MPCNSSRKVALFSSVSDRCCSGILPRLMVSTQVTVPSCSRFLPSPRSRPLLTPRLRATTFSVAEARGFLPVRVWPAVAVCTVLPLRAAVVLEAADFPAEACLATPGLPAAAAFRAMAAFSSARRFGRHRLAEHEINLTLHMPVGGPMVQQNRNGRLQLGELARGVAPCPVHRDVGVAAELVKGPGHPGRL